MSTSPYLQIPPDNWDIVLLFQIANVKFQLPLIKSIDKEKFLNFRTYLVFLSMIGFVYRCCLEKNMIAGDFVYNIESIDLTYWHRVIYKKLMLDSKPNRPIIKLSCNVNSSDLNNYEITPLQIEVHCNDKILEVFPIEQNGKNQLVKKIN